MSFLKRLFGSRERQTSERATPPSGNIRAWPDALVFTSNDGERFVLMRKHFVDALFSGSHSSANELARDNESAEQRRKRIVTAKAATFLGIGTLDTLAMGYMNLKTVILDFPNAASLITGYTQPDWQVPCVVVMFPK